MWWFFWGACWHIYMTHFHLNPLVASLISSKSHHYDLCGANFPKSSMLGILCFRSQSELVEIRAQWMGNNKGTTSLLLRLFVRAHRHICWSNSSCPPTGCQWPTASGTADPGQQSTGAESNSNVACLLSLSLSLHLFLCVKFIWGIPWLQEHVGQLHESSTAQHHQRGQLTDLLKQSVLLLKYILTTLKSNESKYQHFTWRSCL